MQTAAREGETSSELASPSSDGQQLVHRFRFLGAMAVAATIFWYFGGWVARPDDPGGAISLLMVDQGVVTMAELLGLAVVVSGLAVAICGAGSTDRGPLAIAVGLATLGLHGSQIDKLVLDRLSDAATNLPAQDPFPVWGLIAETWLWLALIGVGFVVGRWVQSWYEPQAHATPLDDDRRFHADHGLDIRQGAGTLIVAFLVAWILVTYTAGNDELPLLKGQIYFSVICAFLVASLIAHWFFQSATRLWMLLAVALVATVAYIYGEPDPDTIAEARSVGAYITVKPIVRPLPIEYASLGAIGTLFEADAMSMLRALFGLAPSDRHRTDARSTKV